MVQITARRAPIADIVKWRDLYREEMNCQVVHDSIHARPGWSEAYLLLANGTMAGYGLIAVAGPWKGRPTVYEFYVLPDRRSYIFDLFESLLTESRAVGIEVQTNDPLLTVMVHVYCNEIECEKIVFHDRLTTSLPAHGAAIRRVAEEDITTIADLSLECDAEWLLQAEGTIVATGGILFHYNRPYGDIYMTVAEPYRRRGFGSFLVQELKRVCYDGGSVPTARCSPSNIASRKTLQRAGLVPCGNMLVGKVMPK